MPHIFLIITLLIIAVIILYLVYTSKSDDTPKNSYASGQKFKLSPGDGFNINPNCPNCKIQNTNDCNKWINNPEYPPNGNQFLWYLEDKNGYAIKGYGPIPGQVGLGMSAAITPGSDYAPCRGGNCTCEKPGITY
jgi:hypothetical protein